MFRGELHKHEELKRKGKDVRNSFLSNINYGFISRLGAVSVHIKMKRSANALNARAQKSIANMPSLRYI